MKHSLRSTLLAAGAALSAVLIASGIADAEDRPVRFASAAPDRTLIAGTVSLPDGEGPHPGVVILSGSGPQDRDGRDPSLGELRPYHDLAAQLVDAGYAVLRFDDRGAGETPGDMNSATVADLTGDAVGAWRTLAGADGIDPHRVAILGHSEGGAIAFAAVAEAAPAAIVSLAGPAVDFREIFSAQYRAQQEATGDDQAAITANQQFLSIIYAEMDRQADASPSEARAALAAVFERLGLPPEAGLDMLSSNYMRSWYAHDVRATIRAYDGPVLALYGEHDLSVLPAQNAASMGGWIDPMNGSEVRVIAGHNHLFQPVESPLENPADQPQAVDPEVVTSIIEWLDQALEE